MDTNRSIVLGGGCFWCTEATFQRIKGVDEVTPGYAGGEMENPTYEQVTTGITGHAEVVKVEFDPDVISLAELLDIFWVVHDPTSLNHQGADWGAQYRSIILYADKEQKAVAEAAIEKIRPLWEKPVTTELKPLEVFWPAEELHKNYFQKDPGKAYCRIVINPKLEKLQTTFGEKLKG